jgi:hypothetical protein
MTILGIDPRDNRLRWPIGSPYQIRVQFEDGAGGLIDLTGRSLRFAAFRSGGEVVFDAPFVIDADTATVVFPGSVSLMPELDGAAWQVAQLFKGGATPLFRGSVITVDAASDQGAGAGAPPSDLLTWAPATQTLVISSIGTPGLSPWDAAGVSFEEYDAGLRAPLLEAVADASAQVGDAITELGEATSDKFAEVDDHVALKVVQVDAAITELAEFTSDRSAEIDDAITATNASGANADTKAELAQTKADLANNSSATALAAASAANAARNLSGLTPPAAGLGLVGNTYTDTLNRFLYGPKTADGWGVGRALKGDPSEPVDQLGTYAEVVAMTVPAAFKTFRTSGRSAPGDRGDARYRRVTSQPAHPGRVQDAAGAWFELTDVVVRPEMFGAASATTVDSAIVDQTTLIQAAINYLAATVFGGTLLLSGWHAVAGLSIPSKVRIAGAGQLVSGFTKSTAAGRSTAAPLSFAGNAAGILFEDFTIDGKGFADNSPHVYLGGSGGTDTTFRRVGFVNGGIQPSILAHWSAPQRNFRVEHCRFSNMPRGGIQILPTGEAARGSSGLYFEYNIMDRLGSVGICIHHGNTSGDSEFGFTKEIYVRSNIMTNPYKPASGVVDLIPLEIWGWDGGECTDNYIDGGTRGLSAGAGGRGILYSRNRILNQTFYAIECGKMRSCVIDSNIAINCPCFAAFSGAGNDLSYDVFDCSITNNRCTGTGLAAPTTGDYISGGNNAPVARNLHISGNRFYDIEWVRTVIRFLASRAAPSITISGNGTGAVATATLKAVAGRIVSAGSGYTSAPAITLSGGGGGTGAAFVCTTNAAGQIDSITMTAAGTGYTSAPELILTGGAGSGATLDASMGIEALAIVAGGSNYTAAAITITNNGGSGFVGTVVVDAGAVTGVTITAPGVGFGRGSTVSVEDNRYLARTYNSTVNTLNIDGARVEIRRNAWRRTAPFDTAHYQASDAVVYRVTAVPTSRNDPAYTYVDNVALMDGARASGTLIAIGANTSPIPFYGVAVRGGRLAGNFSHGALINDTTGTTQIADVDTLSLVAGTPFSLNASIVARRVARTIEGTAPPTVGAWLVGDKVENISASPTTPTNWRCIAGGTPGMWLAIYAGGVEPVLSGYQTLSSYASGDGLSVNGSGSTLKFRTETSGATAQPQVTLSVLWSGRNNNTPRGGDFLLSWGTVTQQVAPVLSGVRGDVPTVTSALDGNGRMETTITFPNSAGVPAGLRISAIRGNGSGATLAQISAQAT